MALGSSDVNDKRPGSPERFNKAPGLPLSLRFGGTTREGNSTSRGTVSRPWPRKPALNYRCDDAVSSQVVLVRIDEEPALDAWLF